jgi:hypothetical protein
MGPDMWLSIIRVFFPGCEGVQLIKCRWKKVTTVVSGLVYGSPVIDHYGDMVVSECFSVRTYTYAYTGLQPTTGLVKPVHLHFNKRARCGRKLSARLEDTSRMRMTKSLGILLVVSALHTR